MESTFFGEESPRLVPRFGELTLADLPVETGLFPLSGTLLLPRGKLPLNVFEPRYIALVEDALASDRLIGMIQPVDPEDEADELLFPSLFGVGCLGRITSFTERGDGTFAITLTGISRFRVLRESGIRRGYRRARIDVSRYGADLNEVPSAPFDREVLLSSLRAYFRVRHLHARWDVLEQMPDDMLLITLPMICPFPAAEKQLLLEAETLTDRVQVLQTLLDFPGLFPDDPDDV
ncbi:LON peptidase substrate-binding domain-containing protein [Acetobacter sp. AN02]|nr:LON peptidase substrate-binding domain-containing protein [Acetobacter sp. AN02]MDG6094999.1 LON peptidase substrate-binding domain-containing protein [Acetobacter sp. AN02]